MVYRRAGTSDDIAKNADLKMQIVSGILTHRQVLVVTSGRNLV